MKRLPTLFLLIFAFLLCNSAFAQGRFEKYFFDKTMRVDFYHTGTKGLEVISLDKVYEEPAVLTHNRQLWAGSKNNLLDTLNLGKYLAKVIDVRTNELIFSRGFCSLYGEWETTSEAEKGIHRTFHESVLLPFPKNKIQFIIAKRNRENYFENIFSTVIDPNSRFVNREAQREKFPVSALFKNGNPHKKVDLAILAEGYGEDEIPLFHKDMKRLVAALFETEPFKSHKNDFNVWYVDVASVDSGIDEPRKNQWKQTALSCSYNSFDSPRYALTFDNRAVRDVASLVPYDRIYILMNSDRYGGGGIFNLYAVSYAREKQAKKDWIPKYVFIHEFGHAFAGLGDEYYSSSVAYNEFYPLDVDPWEPNVAILHNGHVKWENLMEKDTPIPTPWHKEEYDSLNQELLKLNRNDADFKSKYQEIKDHLNELMKNQPYKNKIGAFEGSGYSSKGLYRPYLNCIMYSKTLEGFCPVCSGAIEKMIRFYVQ